MCIYQINIFYIFLSLFDLCLNSYNVFEYKNLEKNKNKYFRFKNSILLLYKDSNRCFDIMKQQVS